MERYFIHAPRRWWWWALFRFDCMTSDEAVRFFDEATPNDPWCALYVGCMTGPRIARKEAGVLIDMRGRTDGHKV